jgi:hypothetical protein
MDAGAADRWFLVSRARSSSTPYTSSILLRELHAISIITRVRFRLEGVPVLRTGATTSDAVRSWHLTVRKRAGPGFEAPRSHGGFTAPPTELVDGSDQRVAMISRSDDVVVAAPPTTRALGMIGEAARGFSRSLVMWPAAKNEDVKKCSLTPSSGPG